MAQKQFIVFNLSGQSFGIDISRIVQIINPSEVFKIPDTPDFVEGLINLRGTVYTIFNTRKKLAISEPSQAADEKIIIVTTDSATVGLKVDAVNEIATFKDEDFVDDNSLAAECDSKYVSSIIKKDDQVIFILNLEQVTAA